MWNGSHPKWWDDCRCYPDTLLTTRREHSKSPHLVREIGLFGEHTQCPEPDWYLEPSGYDPDELPLVLTRDHCIPKDRIATAIVESHLHVARNPARFLGGTPLRDVLSFDPALNPAADQRLPLLVAERAG